MKQSLDKLAQISVARIDSKNSKEIAEALWFELNKSKRISSTDILIDKIRRLYESKQNRSVAKLISAHELSEEEIELVRKKIETKFNKQFYLETQIDRSLLGGLKVQIDDEVIDLSWQGKLSQLNERLAGGDE